MTHKGQPPDHPSLRQRVGPRRVAQLEQQAGVQGQLLVNRALSDLSNLVNALQILTEQANAGHPGARQVLGLLLDNLEVARAAAAGLTLVRGQPPPAG